MTVAGLLRALAEGFAKAAAEAESIDNESAASAKPAKGKKAAAAPESVPAAATPAATSTAAMAPAVTQPPAQSPPAPTISKEKLNKAVLAVAGVNREAAVKILAKHNAANTATIPTEKYQAVFDDFEEEKARLDAAAAQASLV